MHLARHFRSIVAFQFELFSEQLVVKTAVTSHSKLPISVSGKTTGESYDKNKDTTP